MHPGDTQLTCAICAQPFVYTAGERELHLLRGVATLPTACPTCRRNPLSTASSSPPARRARRPAP